MSGGNEHLSYIEEELIDAGDFLEHFNDDDSSKLKCLESFALSSKVVKWIQKETKGRFIISAE